MSSESRLVDRFRQVQARVESACKKAGRDPSDVTLVGASKSQPIERLSWAWSAGLRVFGENRVQEAIRKSASLPSEIDWHLIGPLQSNKVKKAVEIFSTVHSIDRVKIAHALDREAARRGRTLKGFLEINLAGESTKHGFNTEGFIDQVETLAQLGSLDIVGLMAIPPLESNADKSRQWFRRLRELRDDLIADARWSDCPGYLSMGMSQDFELAIEEGATHVRIGTALFGSRQG